MNGTLTVTEFEPVSGVASLSVAVTVIVWVPAVSVEAFN